jgi:hypothetical protein
MGVINQFENYENSENYETSSDIGDIDEIKKIVYPEGCVTANQKKNYKKRLRKKENK